MDVTNSRSALALASIHSFSFFPRHVLCRKIARMPRYDRKDVEYCNMYMGMARKTLVGEMRQKVVWISCLSNSEGLHFP
jgi:hypothetical protein